MKLIKQVSILAVIILFSSCSQNKEEINLVLQKNVGDKQTIVSTTETSSGALMSLKSTTEIDFTVSEANDTVYTLTADVLRMVYETKMGNEIENYDSDKKESEMTSDEKFMHSEFKDILDSEFEISIDNKGNISEPFHYLNGDAAESPVDMSNIQIIFPETKVKVGSIWENERTNPLTSSKNKAAYRIMDISDKEITIAVSLIISESLGGLLKENKATGEYILDRKTCNLIKGNLEMNLQTGGKVTKTFYTK